MKYQTLQNHGYMCKHNLDCWNQKEYLAFGVSASSYIDRVRAKNTDSIEDYIRLMKKGQNDKIDIIEEVQDEKDQMNEYMILGLRKIKGIQIDDFIDKFHINPLVYYEDKIKKLLSERLIELDYNEIKLSKKGLDLANVVWEEFV